MTDEWFVHVSQPRLAHNRKHGTNDPVIRIQKGKRGAPTYAYRVRVNGEMLYSPHKPILPCGARLVIRTEVEPEVVE